MLSYVNIVMLGFNGKLAETHVCMKNTFVLKVKTANFQNFIFKNHNNVLGINIFDVFLCLILPLIIILVIVGDESDEFAGKKCVWRRGWGHKMHSHDVRCIEIADNLVLSGGVDRKIVVARQKRKEGETTKVKS
jgi:hypothetical protein